MQPLISIVMPVYNTENFVEQAVRSVIDQTEKSWELILVDDASTDASFALCDALAAEDTRISVIHLPKNGGLSNARNAGMKLSRGRYLMFMDSDDWIESDLLERLAGIVRQNPAPRIIVWGTVEEHYAADGRLIEERRVVCPAERLEEAAAVRQAALKLEQATLLGYAWNKLYDMELIWATGVQFECVPLIEDILFNLQMLESVDRMEILDCTPYHYARRTDGSLTHRFLPYYYEMSMRRVSEILDMYDRWGMAEQAEAVLSPIYARYVLSALERNCDPRAGMNARARREFVCRLFESELYGRLSQHLRQGGIPERVIALRNETICLLAGRVIRLIKTRMNGLFVRISRQKQEEGRNEAADHRSAQL